MDEVDEAGGSSWTAEFSDAGGFGRVTRREVGRVPVFVTLEGESGGHRAAEQGPGARGCHAGAHPGAGRDGQLDVLAAEEVGAQDGGAGGAVGGEKEEVQGVAQVEVPDLVGGEAVQGRVVVGGEEGDDGGALGAAVGACGTGPGLPEQAAFARDRLQAVVGDEVIGGRCREGQTGRLPAA